MIWLMLRGEVPEPAQDKNSLNRAVELDALEVARVRRRAEARAPRREIREQKLRRVRVRCEKRVDRATILLGHRNDAHERCRPSILHPAEERRRGSG